MLNKWVGIFFNSFSSDADARKAMTKDRQNMQHRYVELFYEGGPPGAGVRGGIGGGGMGGRGRGGFGGQPAAAGGYGGDYGSY